MQPGAEFLAWWYYQILNKSTEIVWGFSAAAANKLSKPLSSSRACGRCYVTMFKAEKDSPAAWSWQKDTFHTAYWPVIRANGDHQIDVAQVLHRFLNFPATETPPMWVVPAPGHAPHLGRVICSRVLSTDDQVLNIRPSFWASLFRAPNANLLKWNIFLVTIKWIEWYSVPIIIYTTGSEKKYAPEVLFDFKQIRYLGLLFQSKSLDSIFRGAAWMKTCWTL